MASSITLSTEFSADLSQATAWSDIPKTFIGIRDPSLVSQDYQFTTLDSESIAWVPETYRITFEGNEFTSELQDQDTCVKDTVINNATGNTFTLVSLYNACNDTRNSRQWLLGEGENQASYYGICTAVNKDTPTYSITSLRSAPINSNSDDTDDDNDNTGYFTLYNIKGTTEKFAVVDAGTVNKNGTSSGPSIAIVKTSTTQRTFEKAYAQLDFVDSGDCIVTLKAELGEKDLSDMELTYDTYSTIEDVPADTDTVKTKVIGRVKKVSNKLKMYQDHVGIIYFDFTKESEYQGSFKISLKNESTDGVHTYTVTGGRVRLINRHDMVQPIEITKPSSAQTIYIHATRQDSTVSAVIEASSSVPNDDDYNSYYIIGYIDANGAIIQEHHGGTPLFVFFENC